MTLNLSFYAAIVIASAATSCERLASPEPDKVVKTEDWTEEVTLVISSEIGTVYDMEGEPSEGIKYREEGKNGWNPAHFWEIEGFEYFMGYEYRLKVEKTHLANPPQDASSIRYRLVEILSEEFKLDEGYEMSDDYILYAETSYSDRRRENITKVEGEYYLAIDKSKKKKAIAYLSDNGFAIEENSDEGTGDFYRLDGALKDCIQLTVKGAGDIDDVPGALYISPLYAKDGINAGTFGRGNVIAVGCSSKWDEDKISRYQKYIQRYAEMLKLDYLGAESRYFKYGVTKESAGNVIQIHNWFSEVADLMVDMHFPEWAPTID